MRWRAVALAVAVVASACGSAVDETVRSPSGAITEPGRLGLRHLQPGDCLRDELADEVEVLVGVPCNRDHRGQVVSIGRAEEYDLDDPRIIDELCTAPVEEIGRQLVSRTDLPQVDVALLFAEDGSRVACILEFADPIREDLVRTTT
ncbi:MAG: hypothetical protein AAGC53_05495 [Actinomycetota bacterium]